MNVPRQACKNRLGEAAEIICQNKTSANLRSGVYGHFKLIVFRSISRNCYKFIMSYNHKSGAFKRKEKRLREEKSKCGQQTLFSVGFIKDSFVDHLDDSSSASINENSLTVSDLESVEDSEEQAEQLVETVDIAIDQSNPGLLDEASALAGTSSEAGLTDIGYFEAMVLTEAEMEQLVRSGPQQHPPDFPKDVQNRAFPTSLLQCTLPNNETVHRDWLVWSSKRQALFCFPCRLFSTQAASTRSSLASPSGYPAQMQWKRLYEKLPEHQNSSAHKECYLKWRYYEKNLKCKTAIFMSIHKQLDLECDVWKQILTRLLDVTLFLGERGLAFRGDTQRIGESNNGNFSSSRQA